MNPNLQIATAGRNDLDGWDLDGFAYFHISE
jgi:hypothetical protein